MGQRSIDPKCHGCIQLQNKVIKPDDFISGATPTFLGSAGAVVREFS